MLRTDSLSGKVALITGGGGAIGRSIGASLHARGSQVVLADLDPNVASSVATELSQSGEVGHLGADVSDFDSVRAMIGAVVADYGRIDILVNSAGVSPKHNGHRLDAFETSSEDWHHIISTNLDSVFYCSMEAARFMRAQNSGAIVNISSVVARTCTGNPSAAYVASKAGVEGLTRALAIELVAHGIRVNAVAPGRVETPMTAAAAPEVWARELKTIPAARAAQPHEIAAAAVFLASEASSFMIGSTMDVSGGRGIV